MTPLASPVVMMAKHVKKIEEHNDSDNDNVELTPVGGAGDKMGGYKGYGWATTVELLCTAFQSGPFGEEVCGVDRATGKPKPMPLGHFFLAIDIESLCSLKTFKRTPVSC